MTHRILCMLGCLLIAGCLKTRADLDAEKTEQQEQKQTVADQKANRTVGGQAVAVQEKAPPGAYRFEEYDEAMRTLTGRVDSLENAVAQLMAVKENEKGLTAKDRESQQQKFTAYEEALKKLEAQLAALNDEVARLKAPPPEPTPAAGEVKQTKSLYDQGEDLFNGKKWKEAIVDYQKYRDHSGLKGKQYANATYKIGVCFQELGMKDEAKAFFEEVSAKFPGSKDAKKAALRMKSLK